MVINGQGQPKLFVVDASHPVLNPVASVLLPYCEKLTTRWVEQYTTHGVQKGLIAEGHGWMVNFELDYSGILDGQIFLDLKEPFRIVDVNRTGRMLVLMPRVDVPELQFNVKWTDGFEFSSIFDVGHEGVVFNFEGLDLEPEPMFVGTGWGSCWGCTKAGWGYEF